MAEASAWWPAIAILLTAISAAIVYWAQKAADRKSALIELRRTAYRDYLVHLTKLADSTTSQTAYNSLVAELNVIGTDDVLFAIGEFNQYMNGIDSAKRQPEIYKKLIAKIVLRMRKDCFSESTLDIHTAAMLLPFK